MRFTSLCAVLGAALLPVAIAAPCRPSKPTSALETTATSTAASETAATTLESSATYASTSVIETTLTETATSAEITATDFTTLVSSTAESTASEDATTTTAEEAGPTNFVDNGDFEDTPNSDWTVRTAQIKKDSTKAHAGKRYAELSVKNTLAVGGNHINQTINGLDTANIYRLSFYVTVLNEELSIGAATCKVEALQGSAVIGSWPLDYQTLGQYKQHTVDFRPIADGFEFDLRLRCTQENKVTLTVALDDVSITEVGPAPEETD
ncbi:hypothetical protein ACHAPI_006954 [Fusarium lateritium]